MVLATLPQYPSTEINSLLLPPSDPFMSHPPPIVIIFPRLVLVPDLYQESGNGKNVFNCSRALFSFITL